MNQTTLLILSDSHGHPASVSESIRRTNPDGILFAGDGLRDFSRMELPCPLWAVQGNCDFLMSPLIIGGNLQDPPLEELLMFDGIRILLMHGHRYGVKSGLSVAVAHAAHREADILIFGHTHLPTERRLIPGTEEGMALTKPLILFNPGSIGDSTSATFGTLTLRNGVPLLAHGRL